MTLTLALIIHHHSAFYTLLSILTFLSISFINKKKPEQFVLAIILLAQQSVSIILDVSCRSLNLTLAILPRF